MRRTVIARVFGAALVLLAASVVACNSDQPDLEVVASTGSVGFALSVADATLDMVDYTLSGPNQYLDMGSFSVAGAGKSFSHVLERVPVGMGYQLMLSATTSDARACVGTSSGFGVAPRESVDLPVTLSCEGRKINVGSVDIDATLNLCPVVLSSMTHLTDATVGTTLSLGLLGADENIQTSPLRYLWSATGPAGFLAHVTKAVATFTCKALGTSNIELTVDNGDEQCPGNTLELSIRCNAGSEGGSHTPIETGGAAASSASAAPTTATGTCTACELSKQFCTKLSDDCSALTGEINGVAKSKLCLDVAACVEDTQCASHNGSESPSDCLCGAGVDVGVCSTQTITDLQGQCKDIIAAGAESTSVVDIITRLRDPAFAVGRAMWLSLCEARLCVGACASCPGECE